MNTITRPAFDVLGVVIARAGSAGLTEKHLRPLAGREVVAWTFEHVRRQASLTRVVVSTDCPDVRRLAKTYGLAAVTRPPELATDTATVQDALLHALDEAERFGTFRASAVACLYGNVPVRPADLTDRCVDLLRRTGGCSVRTFTPVGKWHPRWMASLDADHTVRPLHAGSIDRRQDLEPLVLHDGGGLVMARHALEWSRTRRTDPHAMFGTDRRGLAVEAGDCIEIDTPRDLSAAEAALRAQGLGCPAVRLAA